MDKYPTFQRGEVKSYYENLPKEEKKIIDDYVKYVSITSSSQRRLDNVRRSLAEFSMLTKKSLNNITLQDLRDYLALLNSSNKTQSTRNDLKHNIKRFLKNHYKDWSERFNNLEDVRLNMSMNQEKINADSLITKKDIDKIMDAEKSVFWKAFFISLYESGLRPIELRTLTWDKIKFDVDDTQPDLSEINIYASKTSKARSVYVKESTYWLKRLKEESTTPLVFPSVKDKTKPMGKELPAVWLKRISERVLGKPVWPYLLRHVRATELYNNADIPDKTAQKFLGHSKSMGDVYTHLSNKDVKDALSKTIYKKRKILTKQEQDDIDILKKEMAEIKSDMKGLLEFNSKVIVVLDNLNKAGKITKKDLASLS